MFYHFNFIHIETGHITNYLHRVISASEIRANTMSVQPLEIDQMT